MDDTPRLSVSEAIARVRALAPRAGLEHLPLDDALGRILAADLAARADHPGADDSALDGYACRAADTEGAAAGSPAELRVVGEAAAGRPFDGRVGPGEAVRIMTGAPVPTGADAIAPVEVAREEGGRVRLSRPARREDIRPRAQDLRAGETYLRAGERLDAAALALAAAMGHGEVPVRARPRVAVLSTGDEVVPPGAPLAPGQVFDSNAFAVAALARAAGCAAWRLPRVADDPEGLARALEEGGGADLLVTSGGVSMGRYDVVRDLAFEEGEVVFWKLALKPGGPALFARWRGLPLLGLPGNPVSSMVVFLLLGRAFTDAMTDRHGPLPYEDRVEAEAAVRLAASGAKETLVRVALEARPGRPPLARPTGSQSSGVLRSMRLADALAVLPPGHVAEAGGRVEVIPLAPHLG